MATYKEIFGKQIKVLATDPTNESEGQIWYNTTSDSFKTTLTSTAWSSSAPIITARRNLGSSASSTQTAGIVFGGTPGVPVVGLTEEYNGSGWTAGGAMNTPRRDFGGAGIQTATLAFGGTSSAPGTETYDGTSWTSVNDLNTARNSLGGAGLQTAALAFGGSAPASKNETESWNGTSWTISPLTLTAGRAGLGGLGTQTAALAVDGGSPGNATEEFDGAAWTAAATTTTTRPEGTGEAGTQTAGLVYGGAPATAATEGYDGSAWSARPSMATGRGELGFGGTQTAALAAGGSPVTAVTEEFNSSGSVITAGAWASGGSMTQVGSGKSATGTQTAGLAWGGYVTSNTQTQVTELYDGTSWTPGGSLPNQNGQGGIVGASGFGTQTAAVSAGGYSQGAVDYYYTTCWKYDGSTWTATGAISPGRARVGPGCGTESAGLTQGGVNPGNPSPNIYLTNTDHFDGSTWTAGGALPVGRAYAGICGTDTAALQMGGYHTPPSSAYSTSFDYNGASWTAAGTMLAPGYGGSHMGGAAANASLVVGGPPAQNINLSQTYNGTNWSTYPSVTTGRSDGACGLGTQTAALAIGNSPAPASVICEEFTGETSAVNYKTITTS
jgi:hypothetical protein